MPRIERLEDVEAWQAARALTQDIYRATDADRFARDFGLRDQIHRAAVSVMANIAEGFDAGSRNEFVRFLSYALRSATEVQSHLYVAADRGYITEEHFQALRERAGILKGQIGAFRRYLRSLDSINGARVTGSGKPITVKPTTGKQTRGDNP